MAAVVAAAVARDGLLLGLTFARPLFWLAGEERRRRGSSAAAGMEYRGANEFREERERERWHEVGNPHRHLNEKDDMSSRFWACTRTRKYNKRSVCFVARPPEKSIFAGLLIALDVIFSILGTICIRCFQ